MLLLKNNSGRDGAGFMPSSREVAPRVRGAAGRYGKGRLAFSLIELLLAMAILGVIVYALYSVFNQTQRALRSSETQSDTSGRGRSIAEMISREIEQSIPTFASQEMNLSGGLEYTPRAQQDEPDRAIVRPRTNVLHNLFFLNRQTNSWEGIGYRVIGGTNGVGILERFSTNLVGHAPYSNLFMSAFAAAPTNSTNFHHLAEGVVHFKLTPYDPNGFRLGYDTTNTYPSAYVIYRADDKGNRMAFASQTTVATNANVILQQSPLLKTETIYGFTSNALPAYLEMELGVLEPDTLKQYNVMLADENPNASGFLSRQISKVHLFRQRIPIRTAAQ